MTPDAELRLTLGLPQDIDVVRATIVEGISKQTHARLEIATTEHLDLQGVLERDAVIDLAPLGFPTRRWTLRVGHVDFIEIIEGSLRYVLNLYPAFWLLKLTTNTRKFRNMSSQQIISQILDEHHVAHEFHLLRETETRKYCAQYRETNFDFIHRLLEFEGIYYSFAPDGTLMLADRSQDSPPTNEASSFDLIEAAGAMQWGEVGIYHFKKGQRVASGRATVNDFNWKKPAVKLLKSAAADADADLEIYDYPVGYRREDQGERLAQHRLEAYRVPSAYVEGSGNVTSFEPARVFTFGNLAHARFAGEYLLVNVHHDYVNRKYLEHEEGKEEEVNYRNHFDAIPRSTPFRPPLVTPHPHIAGCHTATVVGPEGEEIHTDQHGRYRAQFHWDREATGTDEDSRWLRNTQEIATGIVLARVGWEQSIAYVNGDPDRPFGFARNINGAMTPHYGQPANKTRMTMRSPSYPSEGGGFNEFRMEDLAGMQHWDWHAQKDMLGQIDNDRSETIGNDETHKVAASFSWTIGNNQTFTIGGDFKVQCKNAYTKNVNGNRNLTCESDEEVQITEAYAYNIEGDCTETVGADLKVKACTEGMGAITRQVAKTWERTCESDWKVKGEGNFDWRAQGTWTETVGQNKEITCKEGNITYKVSGKCTQKVLKNCVRVSKNTQGYSAKNTTFTITGNCTMSSDDKITINGSEIWLQAEQELCFTQQKLGLKLTPNKIEIQGPLKIEAANEIKMTGNKWNTTLPQSAFMHFVDTVRGAIANAFAGGEGGGE